MSGGSVRQIGPDERRSEEDFNHGLGRSPWPGITMATMAIIAIMTTVATVLQVKVQVQQGRATIPRMSRKE